MSMEQVRERVADYLDEIKGYFKPGVKVTVLVRHENDDEGRLDFMMTDDEPQQVMNMIARRIAAGRPS